MTDPSSTTALTEVGKFSGQIAAVVICWLLLGFSSLSEAALVRMELVRARQLAEERRWASQRLVYLLSHRQEVLSSLILLINLSIIVASAYTTEIAINLSGHNEAWIALASAGMIVFLLVFCEVTPKTYGVRRAEAVALALAPLLFVVYKIMRPVSRLLHLTGLTIIRRALIPIFGGRALAVLPRYSDKEVLELVGEGQANGDIEVEEREMIAGVIEFADKVTHEVMTPRTDIIWIPADSSLLQAAGVSERTGYSRLPVCVEDVDHIIGVLYMKDVVSALGADDPQLTAGQLARKPVPMVPESKQVAELLSLMQRKRLHLAIVIDEYGGTAGLVTIEDLLEEIFGEIRDEHDFESESINPIDEHTAVVDAWVSVDAVEDHFGVELPEGEFDSVGGFILDRLGRLPAAGEHVSWRNLDFAVEAVSENRIQRVRIVRLPKEGEDEEQGGEAE
ncbi:MAG TPA: hemolysin family protein [Armatimonadota bacterium]|nr:hemolysin family protein [Armatimonadota bacterium]